MIKNKKGGGGKTSPFLLSKKFCWLILAAALLIAYVQKMPCLTGSWGAPESVQYRYLCYSDIQALYGFRGLDQKKIPYVEQKPFEYPPLIGFQMYLSALVSKNHPEFLRVNAVFNTVWAVLAFWAFTCLLGFHKNLLWMLLAPPFVFHLHINWDISTVTSLAFAMLFWKRKKFSWVGFCLGIGFTGKMFPVFVIPFLLLSLFKDKEESKEKILKLLFGVALGIFSMNLPILLLDWVLNKRLDAVLGVFGFHAGRTPDFGTFWYWLGESFGYDPTSRSFTRFVDTTFLLGMTLSLIYFLRKIWNGKTDVWTGAAGMTAVCLLLSKVHSLQYSLWMLPFFVILRGFTKTRILYLSADLLIFMFGFWWYGNFSPGQASLCKGIFIFGVYLRAVALALMAYHLATQKGGLQVKENY